MLLARKRGQFLTPIGLDIRDTVVYAVQFESVDGELRLHAAACSRIEQEDSVSSGVPPVTRALKSLLSTYPFVGNKIITAIPSGKVDIRPLTLPAGVVPGNDTAFRDFLEAEAHSMFVYGSQNAILDYLPIESHIEGQETHKSILLVASEKENINRHLALLKTAGLDCVHLDIGPCAIARVLGEDDAMFAAIDIDLNQTIICIAQGPKMLFGRTIKLGTQQLIDELTIGLGVDKTQSARILQTFGINHSSSAKPCLERIQETGLVDSEVIPATLFEICGKALDKFAAELKRSIDYFLRQHQGSPVEKAYLMGALVPANLDVLLSEKLGVPTHLANAFSCISNGASKNISNSCSFVVASGLALRGVQQ